MYLMRFDTDLCCGQQFCSEDIVQTTAPSPLPISNTPRAGSLTLRCESGTFNIEGAYSQNHNESSPLQDKAVLARVMSV